MANLFGLATIEDLLHDMILPTERVAAVAPPDMSGMDAIRKSPIELLACKSEPL